MILIVLSGHDRCRHLHSGLMLKEMRFFFDIADLLFQMLMHLKVKVLCVWFLKCCREGEKRGRVMLMVTCHAEFLSKES